MAGQTSSWRRLVPQTDRSKEGLRGSPVFSSREGPSSSLLGPPSRLQSFSFPSKPPAPPSFPALPPVSDPNSPPLNRNRGAASRARGRSSSSPPAAARGGRALALGGVGGGFGGMFYSKSMLSRKGPLRNVWVAGVCGVAKLTKDQVLRTNVAASVDKILPDVETAYRILGLLLLGVVRIYSKKVEYLHDECDQLLESSARVNRRVPKRMKKGVCARRLVIDPEDPARAKKPARGRISRAENGVMSQLVEVPEVIEPLDLPPIFTIPKRFELDSFDLEIPENREDEDDDHHQLPRKDTLLEDGQHRTSNMYESYQRMPHADLDSACFMPACITLPTEVISVIDEVNDLLYPSNKGDEPENDNQNTDPACFTPVKDVLPPEVMNTMAEVSGLPESRKVKKPRREVNGEENDDSACSIPLAESQETQRSVNAVENETRADLDENCLVPEESENGLLLGKVNTEASVQIADIEEQESLEPATPEPLREGASGLVEKFMVPTPAKNEKRQAARKRRRGLYCTDSICIPTDREERWQAKRKGALVLCDEHIILSNEEMKQTLDGAKDLVCKRRKAPYTYLDAWKVAKLGSLQDTFMDPLIQYSNLVHLSYSTTADAPEVPCAESVGAKKRLSYEPAESHNSRKEAPDAEMDEVTNSIRTPVGCYSQSEQNQDAFDGNGDTPYENQTQVDGVESGLFNQKRLYQSKDHSPLRNQPLMADIHNTDEDVPMDEGHTRNEDFPLSTRTRAVARCLHQLFLDQKCQQQETIPVTLSQALEGSKRKTTARFFYETLILKSRGLIYVTQQNPYEDVVIATTPQLEAVFQSPE
uniref:Uncharacterized protein n=1 Tax=Avena sativa TaxID=4498 RepID=A0ACD5URW7_AVESA